MSLNIYISCFKLLFCLFQYLSSWGMFVWIFFPLDHRSHFYFFTHYWFFIDIGKCVRYVVEALVFLFQGFAFALVSGYSMGWLFWGLVLRFVKAGLCKAQIIYQVFVISFICGTQQWNICCYFSLQWVPCILSHIYV